EVLSAFGLLNDKLTKANVASDQRNQAFLAGLDEKVSEQPDKYKPLQQKAQDVNALAADFDSYINELKSGMMATVEDPNDYEVQDKSDYLDQKLFAGDNLTPAGKEFVAKIDAFREGIVNIVGTSYPSIAADVNEKFSTAKEKTRDGIEVDWLKYHFEGFPLVASRTKLTQMQAD